MFDKFFKVALLVLLASFLYLYSQNSNGRYLRIGDSGGAVFDTRTGTFWYLKDTALRMYRRGICIPDTAIDPTRYH